MITNPAFISRLSRREKSILYGTLTFVLLALTDRLIISPVFSRIKSLNEQIAKKESEIRNGLRILAQKDKIEAIKAKHSTFTGSLDSDEEITVLLKEIEGMASKTSVYLIDMKPGGSKTSGSSKKYTISLNCEAQMEQLVDFMYNIETAGKLFTIEKYQISPKSKASSIARCSMSVSKITVP